ncbi:SIMPL domain-containing protein [Ichthyobacterium seriolicida]|uniref:SIMPL domain-containing protein n=1 Tax=Ichthyobacterium seriolicida TaxID=242600 RepID=A0A1J1EAD1_9FLAO|nr:SIMPL domain-containing protein [Ichthyobacterium seriolicida]BAV94464.1 hypothetical protein JBKA6_0451 [Ichthyobacterium seriolicida]
MSNKKIILFSLIISVGIVVSGMMIGKILVNAKEFDRSVVVKGLAEREVKADLGVWTLKILHSAKNLSEVEKKLEFKINTIYEYLKSGGIEESEIKRNIVSVHDSWNDQFSTPKKHVNRYFGSVEFLIRTSNVDLLQTVITNVSGLISKDITIAKNNHYVNYLFTGLNDIKPEMVEEATKNARKVAEKFAKDSDSRVGKIKNASQGIFSITNLSDDIPQIKKIRIVSTLEFYLRD